MSAEDGVFITKQGKINFVDLAGSEMTKKTHSEGKTLEEANNINKSLMVLGKFAHMLYFPRVIFQIFVQFTRLLHRILERQQKERRTYTLPRQQADKTVG
jgi:Kinesin motor domain